MSDLVSGSDTDNESEVLIHRARLYARAGLTSTQISEKPRMWEKKMKAFRSDEVSIFNRDEVCLIFICDHSPVAK